jgi:aminoglycoside phosphotransferase (APT) family kinase protein
VGYPRLAGVPGIGLDPVDIRLSRLAPVLGAFLTSLHSFPLQTAKQVGAPEYAPAVFLEEVRSEALDDLHMIGPVASGIRENELRSFLEAGVDAGHVSISPIVVHGDLGAEHVLLDPETHEVTGIIDWSEVAVSDPAIDFAGMFHWGGADFTRAVLAHYHGEADEGLMGRARFFAAARGVGDVVFSLRKQRPEYLNSGIRAVRWCLEELGV